MPSSSPTPSVQPVPGHPLHWEKHHGYRQTMYHDKAGIRIAESRRRSGVAGKVEPSTQPYVDFVLYPVEHTQYSSKNCSQDVSYHAAPKTRAAASYSRPHVTSAKHSSINRPEPAIIHAATEQSRTLSGGETTPFQLSGEPTPPPTPRVARLSTPELAELIEAPFCECGVERQIVRCCKTCSKEADLWSTQR
ncbi:uncharacterized protein SETTUDRAFT_158375 [Exserohilum turcica Et28A]|uniref:Uncharacterized protein n=1 Tax=Exserohilum turcicum (strain 28A) TaxID=671987 RepID=R0KP90_EXST2|nr:uncharacterized protein SETTUDRAFT_158375 [Exserohilum turcica Et28A]EOA90879.1 hypothetical protein SETTUDRAFT_158375 [Exserohilum turcica Et28A]